MAPTATLRVTRSSARQNENVDPLPMGKGRVRQVRGGKTKLEDSKNASVKPRNALHDIRNQALGKKVVGKDVAPGKSMQVRRQQDDRTKRVAREKIVEKARFGGAQDENAYEEVTEKVIEEKIVPKATKESQVKHSQPLAKKDDKDTEVAKVQPSKIENSKSEDTTVADNKQASDLTAEIEELALVSASKAPLLSTVEEEEASPAALPCAPAEPDASIPDIDQDDLGYPEFVADYAKDVYTYLHTVERNHQVSPDYMKIQTEITHKMRSILLNWLVDVHLKFKLLQESLYLCVSLLDRYLAVAVVPRDKLQLVGVSCMLIATKFEEIYAPEVRDFVYICEEAYSRDEVLDMECTILNKLKFCIGTTYPLHFLRRGSKAADVTPECHTMGKYLIELTLTNPAMLKYLPSEIAAGCLLLCLKMLQDPGQATKWDKTIEHYTGVTEERAMTMAKEMADFIKTLPSYPHQSTRRKYQSPKFYRVAYTVDAHIGQVCLD